MSSNNSLKRSKTLISQNIFLKNINILEESNKNYSSNYYLSLIINNLHPQNSKPLKFNEKGEATINQLMSLKNEEPKKKYIKLEFYEKDKIYSNLLLKGEIINENYLNDDISNDFICYLYNNENEEKAAVHFDIDFDSVNLNNMYDMNVKRAEKVNKRKIQNENYIYDLFLSNFQYIKLISNDIHSLLNWDDKWKTLSYLFGITFIIIFFKNFFIFIFPLYLIFSHIKNKNNIEKFIIAKDNLDNSNDKKENEIILYKIMYAFNKVVEIYENITKKIIKGYKLTKEVYIRIGVAIFANFLFLYFKLYNLINLKTLLLCIIWLYVLRRNPSFYSFNIFLLNLIQERTLFIKTNINFHIYKTNLINFITIIIPFYSLYRIYYEENIDSSQFIENKNKNDKENLIKYEIYENERWWMFVGWNKNLIFDESLIWYKKDKPKEYCDKNMIKLIDDKYIWESDWKIEIGEYSDENGWEYSKDFESEFGEYSKNKYVRRRKWVRYAIKM